MRTPPASSPSSCTTYRASVRKCKVLEKGLQSCFNWEIGRCGHGNGETTGHAVCDYSERGREQKTNGVRQQNALSAYCYPVLHYIKKNAPVIRALIPDGWDWVTCHQPVPKTELLQAAEAKVLSQRGAYIGKRTSVTSHGGRHHRLTRHGSRFM